MPADQKAPRSSLRDFDAYADRNGQDMGQDEATEIANPADLQRRLASEASGEAEQARLASGRTGDDATDATEAEIPAETVRRLSDASLGSGGKDPQNEAIERATSGLGTPE